MRPFSIALVAIVLLNLCGCTFSTPNFLPISRNRNSTPLSVNLLCGLFKNEDGVVTSVISREEFNASKSEKFIEETFDGSLPALIAAFNSQKN